MFSILQISDLHRSKSEYIGNNELLSSILADHSQFSTSNPPILLPDAILVTGDLVQGLPIGSPDYPAALAKQYDEALELLERLAAELLDGDKSRLVMTPGNHDVDWNCALAAMEEADPTSVDLGKELINPESDYRWCWKTRRLFRIADRSMYDRRLSYFREAIAKFYHGVDFSLEVDFGRSWNNYLLDNDRILLTALSSCHNNDCYRLSGDIEGSSIHEAHLATLDSGLSPELKIAMWHHNLDGPPLCSDYMRTDHLRTLIDRGYRLGLHGHQHKPDAQPHALFLSGKQEMAVLSAGSLCAGSMDRPQGFLRQYSVVELGDSYEHATVHVREMQFPGVFCPGRIPSVSDRSFVRVDWTRAPRDLAVNTARSGGIATRTADRIESLIRIGDLDEAESETVKNQVRLGAYGHRLLIRIFEKAERWSDLEELLDPPASADELALLTNSKIRLQNWESAKALLTRMVEERAYPDSFLKELLRTLALEREAAS